MACTWCRRSWIVDIWRSARRSCTSGAKSEIMDPTPNPIVAPQVQDKRVPPAGILPKNMQALLLCSVAAVMVLVIAFSGRNAPKERSAATGARTPATVDPNTARIQEYQARIEEQTRKLQLEQAQLARTQQNLGVGQDPRASSDAS